MTNILSRRTPLRVKQAEEGDGWLSATAYIAPPDRHLLVNPDIVQEEKTPEFFGMPGAAIQTGSADFVLPLEEIGCSLCDCT